MIQRVVTSGLLLGMLAWVGCGDPGAAPTAKVDGTLTLDGAPLGNATVYFSPAPGAKSGGRQATGTTDSAGKFTLSSFKKNDGAMPGAYVVTVSGTGVPDKYTAAEKTDLKVTVESGKTNPVKLDLKKGE